MTDNNLIIAKDLFLIGAHTGLRVSDFSQLSKRNIIKHGKIRMLKVATQKTGKVVAIPLHNITASILDKYDTLPTMSEPKLNLLIKELGKLANIDSIITTQITKGGKKVTDMQTKYKLITTHTARRSFCTNAYLGGIPTIDIMAISGHTTEKTFLNYIKATAEQKALKIANHDYFNTSTLKAVK